MMIPTFYIRQDFAVRTKEYTQVEAWSGVVV